MICKFCTENILASGKSWGYHQNTSEGLQRAATEGCVFCSTLVKDSGLVGNGKIWPLYRWSIRFPGRSRETMDSMVITFRSMVEEDSKDLWPGSKCRLPQRVFHMFPEDALGHVPSAEEIGKTTDLESAGPQIKSWVQLCDSNHKGCSKQRQQRKERQQKTHYPSVPTRLLAVGTKRNGPVFLIETKNNPVRGPYVSLSHCWGPKSIPFITLTTETRESYIKDGIAWNKLSKNFQEAIEVTRFLEIDYIWIDSLCIMQGPSGDFPSEAPLMHQYYRNAYCNIAAADAPDSRKGLFRMRKPSKIIPKSYKADNISTVFGNRTWRILNQDIWTAKVLQTVLYTRGWVFQERMLAPRIIHFAKDQVFWDCATMSACETIPSGLPQALDMVAATDRHWRGRLQESGSLQHQPLAGAADDSPEHFWKSAVRNYTSCNLTQGSDKLVAIWGIAKLVRDVLGEEYGAGMWENNLEEQLAWRVAECTLDVRPADLRDNPSWSWTSMSGTIELRNRLVGKRCYAVTDHTGNPISFQLVYQKRVSTLSRRNTPHDVGSSVILPAVQKTTSKKRPKMGREYSNPENDPNQEPRLDPKSIAIRGCIVRCNLCRLGDTTAWTFSLPGYDAQHQTNSTIEAFPDVKPPCVEVDFVVLAASRSTQKPLMQESILNTAESSSILQSISSTASIGEHKNEALYSGVGIILEKTLVDGHFRRTGAFQFRDSSEETWRILRSASQQTVGRDVDFWLE